MNTNEELCKHIYECECELLKSDVRLEVQYGNVLM